MKYNCDKESTCCFTGHRLIAKYELSLLPKRINAALVDLYNNGYRTFIGGGAIGFDTLAELSVIELRREFNDIRLVLVLPCNDQDLLWSFSQRTVYDRIRRNADEIVVLHESHVNGCMQERNRVMTEMSSACIAYFSGRSGGTGYTVNHCLKNGLRIINLFEKI